VGAVSPSNLRPHSRCRRHAQEILSARAASPTPGWSSPGQPPKQAPTRRCAGAAEGGRGGNRRTLCARTALYADVSARVARPLAARPRAPPAPTGLRAGSVPPPPPHRVTRARRGAPVSLHLWARRLAGARALCCTATRTARTRRGARTNTTSHTRSTDRRRVRLASTRSSVIDDEQVPSGAWSSSSRPHPPASPTNHGRQRRLARPPPRRR